MNTRTLAAKVLLSVIKDGTSLTTALHDLNCKDNERGLIHELCYGTLRWYHRLLVITQHLIPKPLKSADSDVLILILLGLYQLIFTRIPSHAAISETVEAARQIQKDWATKLINGVLRNYQRNTDTIEKELSSNLEFIYSHPAWIIDAIKTAYPDHWQTILEANNQQAPLTLRVNRKKISVDDYFTHLQQNNIVAQKCNFSSAGIILEQAQNVQDLPGFFDGWFSVQDEAAQLAGYLLNTQHGESILDACAAPGGKTTHILETVDQSARVLAIDNDEHRLKRVHENLQRLQLLASIKCADVKDVVSWWDGKLFDRILLDAPCSATGVIRRHPDIKLLRRASDISQLHEQQFALLQSLWSLLKPQGILLYATCSILPTENFHVLKRFLKHQTDATEIKIDSPWGHAQIHGKQIFPGENNMDGFYYAKLCKD